jgi:Virulence factor BrkB
MTGWWDVAKRLRTQVRDDRIPLLSAGVAFYAMLSIFPALIAVISIYGLVAPPRSAMARSKSWPTSCLSRPERCSPASSKRSPGAPAGA